MTPSARQISRRAESVIPALPPTRGTHSARGRRGATLAAAKSKAGGDAAPETPPPPCRCGSPDKIPMASAQADPWICLPVLGGHRRATLPHSPIPERLPRVWGVGAVCRVIGMRDSPRTSTRLYLDSTRTSTRLIPRLAACPQTRGTALPPSTIRTFHEHRGSVSDGSGSCCPSDGAALGGCGVRVLVAELLGQEAVKLRGDVFEGAGAALGT